MDKTKMKKVLLPALAAVAFAGVGIGSTFALFTDKAEAAISVAAGIVDVRSSVSVSKVYELNDVEVLPDSEGLYTNSIGGTVEVDSSNSAVTLAHWAPGDKAEFIVEAKNLSTVAIKTRFVESHTHVGEDLYPALKISYVALDKDLNDITERFQDWDAKLDPVSEADIAAGGVVIASVRVIIEFPNVGTEITSREEGENNHYQNADCVIKFTQQAVQGNASVLSLLEEMNALTVASTEVNGNLHAALEEVSALADESTMLDRHFVWNAAEDKFYYLSDAAASANKYNFFKIYESMPLVSEGYSIYAYGTGWNTTHIVDLDGIGFDAGDVMGITAINYTDSGDAKTVVIRTNEGDLDINAPLDTVRHYGYADSLTIIAANNSYHEYGTIGAAKLKQGRLVVEDGGSIANLSDEGTAEKTIIVEENGTVLAVDPEIATEIDGEGVYPGSPIEPTEDQSILHVSTFGGLQALAEACNNGQTFEGYTIKLDADIDFEGKVWVPFGRFVARDNWYKNGTENVVLRDSRFFMGNIDGNGHKLLHFSNVGFAPEKIYESNPDAPYAEPWTSNEYGLIRLATGDITIKDLEVNYAYENISQKIKGNGIIAQYFTQELEPIVKVTFPNGVRTATPNSRYNTENGVYNVQTTTVHFKNVKTTGTIIGKDSMAAFVGTTYSDGTNPQTLDAKGIYEWRSAKYAFESNEDRTGDDRSKGANKDAISHLDNHNPTQMRDWLETNYVRNGDGCGWYADSMGIKAGDREVKFYHNNTELLLDDPSGEDKFNYTGYAPLYVNYIFEDCVNEADVTSTSKRAGIFFAKVSLGTALQDMGTISFINSSNSGNVVDESTNTGANVAGAGIMAGFYAIDMVLDLTGLTNTGTARWLGTTYEGAAALIRPYDA